MVPILFLYDHPFTTSQPKHDELETRLQNAINRRVYETPHRNRLAHPADGCPLHKAEN